MRYRSVRLAKEEVQQRVGRFHDADRLAQVSPFSLARVRARVRVTRPLHLWRIYDGT